MNDFQERTKSPIFWLGAISAVFEGFINFGIGAGVEFPWFVGAIGGALSAFLLYAVGNNPSLKRY